MSEHQIKFYQTGTFTVGNRLLQPDQRSGQANIERYNSLNSCHRACQGCGEALGARYAVDAAMRATEGRLIAANATGSLGVHDLKTRQAGAATFVVFDLVVPSAMAVGEAHEICDRLEDAVQAAHPGARVVIHVEPESEKAHGVRVRVRDTASPA